MGTTPNLRVVAAAIRDVDGHVFSLPAPARHCHITWMMHMFGRPQVEGSIQGQGFLLSDGSFADRKRARAVAIAAGQLLPRDCKLEELYSEDVW